MPSLSAFYNPPSLENCIKKARAAPGFLTRLFRILQILIYHFYIWMSIETFLKP